METVGFDAVIAGYLAAYTDVTRTLYRGHINSWLSWCAENQIDPTRADRSHIEVYGRWLREMGRAKGTQASALNTICGLYRYAYETGYLDHDPGERVRRPRIVKHSAGTWLDRRQARDFLAVSRTMGARDAALCHLLLLNGPRIGEAVGLDVTDYHPGERPWARFRRKMDWMQDVALAPAAAETLDAYIGDRDKGPIFLGPTRKRLTRDDANAIVAAVAFRAGIPGITPHSLRRSFCTLSRDAGAEDRDIMASGGWASKKMLDYYDMGRRGMKSAAPSTLQQYLSQ